MQGDRSLISKQHEQEQYYEQNSRGVAKRLKARKPPSSPIPLRASAKPSRVVKARSRSLRSTAIPEGSDVTRIPTSPPPTTVWQHDSPNFTAESSLFALSLVEADALPVPSLPTIEEFDTQPVAPTSRQVDERAGRDFYEGNAQADISEFDTHPDAHRQDTYPRAISHRLQVPMDSILSDEDRDVLSEIPTHPTVESRIEAALAARHVLSELDSRPGEERRYHKAFLLKSLDHLRWWLLYPGRLEFLLWLGGTLLLLGATTLFALATVFSLGVLRAQPAAERLVQASPQSSAIVSGCVPGGQKQSCGVAAPALPNLKLTRLEDHPLVQGEPVRLQGQGFSKYGRVNFFCDAPEHSCRPDSTLADEHGGFSVALIPGNEPAWSVGQHTVIAFDVKSARFISLTINVAAAPVSHATPVPVGRFSYSSLSVSWI
jgi:hypothetical protein